MYGQLQALLQVDDRTTMAASIESRVPFLTNSIVKEWFSEPISIRMWGVGSKAVPKHIAKQLLPNKVNNRTDKMGFPVPFDHWLKCPAFYDQVRQLFTESHILKQMAPAYRKTILESEVGDIKYNRSLWGMITLAGWERFSY
jgi:asparagine synthase (glutamine-hydrolysing)